MARFSENWEREFKSLQTQEREREQQQQRGVAERRQREGVDVISLDTIVAYDPNVRNSPPPVGTL